MIDKLYEYMLQYGMNILAAILIFVIGRWVAKSVSALLKKILLNAKVNETLALFVHHLIFYGIMAFVIISALNKLGVETSSFIAVIGAASFAVGLALQGSLANFAAGVMLILLHPFRVGDVIETSGAQGTVAEIQIFNTIIVTPDNKRVIIPNAKITTDKIVVEAR